LTSLARWVSIAGHPFAMVAVLVAVSGRRSTSAGETLRALLLVALVAILPVAWLMARKVRRREWGNVDASKREERPLLYAVGLAALLCLLAYLLLFGGNSFLLRGVLGTLALLAAAAVATRWLKVSLHMAFAALAATVLLGSAVGWLLAAFLPLLAWSRLALARHRPAELAVGSLLGLLAGCAVLWG
jgi:membrane-associated phospholipid phosphatase